MTSAQTVILVFLKYPEPGRVKTRLAATEGELEATRIYGWLAKRTCLNLPQTSLNQILYDPFRPEDEYRLWLDDVLPRGSLYAPQSAGNLGDRLTQSFAAAFAEGGEKIAVVGSDCPHITADVFAATWQALETHDMVIGPSTDGGYYLLALKKECAALFQDIAWSTGEVLGQTLVIAAKLGMRTFLLPVLTDVDTIEDWEKIPVALRLLA